MGVVTGGGGGGAAFNGGTITEGLEIADPDAAETQLTITGTGSTSGAKLINSSAVHTTFTVDSDGSLLYASDDLAFASVTGTADSGAQFEVQNNPTNFSVEADASATAATLVVQAPGGVVRAGLSTLYGLLTALNSAPADGFLAAGQCALWFDQTNGAGKLMVKAKTANGTVVTGSLALT